MRGQRCGWLGTGSTLSSRNRQTDRIPIGTAVLKSLRSNFHFLDARCIWSSTSKLSRVIGKYGGNSKYTFPFCCTTNKLLSVTSLCTRLTLLWRKCKPSINTQKSFDDIINLRSFHFGSQFKSVLLDVNSRKHCEYWL